MSSNFVPCRTLALSQLQMIPLLFLSIASSSDHSGAGRGQEGEKGGWGRFRWGAGATFFLRAHCAPDAVNLLQHWSGAEG